MQKKQIYDLMIAEFLASMRAVFPEAGDGKLTSAPSFRSSSAILKSPLRHASIRDVRP
jgi:hypothetical protein